MDASDDGGDGDDDGGEDEEAEEKGEPALTGKYAAIVDRLAKGQADQALVDALAWRREAPGDVLALLALGQVLEHRGNRALAARAYASIIDLFPSRADLRRLAAQRLERLGPAGAALAADSAAEATEQRPDHLTGWRQLAFARVRERRLGDAFAALEKGLAQQYPEGRFAGGTRILAEDLAIVGAAWAAAAPERAGDVDRRLAALSLKRSTEASTRFVLSWETDANDVDFHIRDARGGHAYYEHKELLSGGALYADVTTGYGPECFTIPGEPKAGPYRLRLHYYRRGPMGYGMGELEIMRHDGRGGLTLDSRPFVVMNDDAWVDLGKI
jgi:tetratricopeptide (TPR) repeat protein